MNKVVLGDYVKLQRGTTYKSRLLGLPGPVLLGLASIRQNGGFRSDSLKTYGGESPKKLILRSGDIYVSLKDVTQSADLLGAVSRVPPSISEGRLTQDTVKLIFKSDKISASYIFWLLRTPQYRRYCLARAIGTTNLSLSREDFLSFLVPEPTPDRLALVSVLEALEAKIELNRRMNETLEAMARAIFKSWFVDFDPVRAKAEGRQPFGMDAETAVLFPDCFQDSPLGKIPKGWKVGSLGEIAENPRRGVLPEEAPEGTPYIGLDHMPRKCISLSEWGRSEEVASNKFKYQRGEILFGKLRPYFHKVGVAVQDGVCSTDILVVRAKSPEWFGLVLWLVSSEEFINHADAASTGTKMPRANWTDMARYEICLPEQGIAKLFGENVQHFVERIASNILQSKTLAALRDAILPRLIYGAIRVKDSEKMVEAKV